MTVQPRYVPCVKSQDFLVLAFPPVLFPRISLARLVLGISSFGEDPFTWYRLATLCDAHGRVVRVYPAMTGEKIGHVMSFPRVWFIVADQPVEAMSSWWSAM